MRTHFDSSWLDLPSDLPRISDYNPFKKVLQKKILKFLSFTLIPTSPCQVTIYGTAQTHHSGEFSFL